MPTGRLSWPFVGLLVTSACSGLGTASDEVDEDASANGGSGGSSSGSDAGDGTSAPVDAAPLPLGDVVITEIMYHPVYEQSDVDNHEFVEIYNRSSAPVAIGKWRLASE